MDSTLYDKIRNVTAHRKSRDENKNFVLSHREYLEDLIRFSFDAADLDSHKACWILEFVAYERVSWLQPHLDFICSHLGILKDESAIRPIAKICQLLVTSHFNKDSEIILSQIQLQQITEACFDWLINDTKVAPKAYSIRTLYALGKHFDWIHPELKIIIDKEYSQQSPAYKAVAKQILPRIN